VDVFKLLPLPQGIGLYIHIPFCRRKCAYCDFFSVSDPNPELADAVVRGTLAELEAFLAGLGQPPLKSVYIGGGTPSLLAEPQLQRLLAAVRTAIRRHRPARPPEWTVEANPESLRPRFLEICARYGVNRLSLGLQSFQPRLLELLGRPGTAGHNQEALALLAGSWHQSLNLDLLTGIPGQRRRELDDDLDRTLAARPDHVSLYSLTPPPGTKLAAMIEPAAQERLWFQGFETLEKRGYANYEIANFALPGQECAHNLACWRLEPYLGVGAGAVSTLPGASGEIYRLYNPHDLTHFNRGADAGWGLRRETVTPREFLFEHLMLGFRLRPGIAAAGFRARFGISVPELLPGLWAAWERRGLIVPDTESWRLADAGRFILDSLLLEAQAALEALPESAFHCAWPDRPA
jgi:oxygen-independent coproporphyrinogen-3 oxidase